MRVIQVCRKLYNRWRRARLRDHPTVISRNCLGGVLFHDLGLEFLSPTINMTMPAEDFILLCQHLPAFLAVKMEEVAEHGRPYPVGKLTTDYGTITLYLVHYSTFEAAAETWERRKQRVDLNNIRVILHDLPNAPESLLEHFEQLPYPHKVLFSSGIDEKKYPHCHNLPSYTAGYAGPVTEYKHPFSIRRYQDEYDWIPFLNGEQ